MTPSNQSLLIENILAVIEKLLPEYLANPVDFGIGGGNAAVCIIDSEGRVYGRMFGDDKNRQREIFRVASKKATQVWITGIPTGVYERMVYTGEINPDQFGIMHPDFIGWEGGQPIALDPETQISVGFSGMRGVNDLEIASKAVAEALKEFRN